jgi:hypothetical protein
MFELPLMELLPFERFVARKTAPGWLHGLWQLAAGGQVSRLAGPTCCAVVGPVNECALKRLNANNSADTLAAKFRKILTVSEHVLGCS